MAIQLATTFDLYGSSDPNFSRDKYETTLAMREVDIMDNGHIVYCTETDKHYVFKKITGGTKDATLGWFVELETGGTSYSSGSGITVGETTISVNKGDGLDFNGNVLVVKPKTNSGITVDSNGVSIDKGNGLDFSNNTLVVKPSDGITVGSAGVSVNNGNGLEFSSNALKVKPKTNGGVTVDSDGVGVNVKSDGGISVQSSGLELMAATLSQIGGIKCTVDTANKLFKVMSGSNTWAANIVELGTVAQPTLPANATFTVTSSQSITITNNAAGSTVYYTTDGQTPSTSSSSHFEGDSLDIDLSIDDSAGSSISKVYEVKAMSVLYGEYSSVTSRTYTIKRQLSKPTITVGGDEYDSTRSVTISSSQGATLQYKKTGDTNWTPYTSSFNLETADNDTTITAIATKTNWENSDEASKNDIKIGTLKMHWGIVTSIPTTDAQVKALTGGHIKQKVLPVSAKLPSSGVSNNTFVFACASNITVTKINDGTFDQQIHNSTTPSYNVYAVTNLSSEAAGKTFTMS